MYLHALHLRPAHAGRRGKPCGVSGAKYELQGTPRVTHASPAPHAGAKYTVADITLVTHEFQFHGDRIVDGCTTHHPPAAPVCRVPCPGVPEAGDILFSWVLLMGLRRVVGDILVLTLHSSRNFSPSLFKNSIIFISLPITAMCFSIRGYNLIVPSMYFF